MVINYIYDESGTAQYAIVPIQLWNEVQQHQPIASKKKIFNPLQYKGLIRPLQINIEQELKNMRDEWERNF
jgi:hypothetical protein